MLLNGERRERSSEVEDARFEIAMARSCGRLIACKRSWGARVGLRDKRNEGMSLAASYLQICILDHYSTHPNSISSQSFRLLFFISAVKLIQYYNMSPKDYPVPSLSS